MITTLLPSGYEQAQSVRLKIEQSTSRWGPEFCAKVVEQTQVSFYKELVTLTHDFIRCDEEYVARCIENGSKTTSDLDRVPLQTGAP